MRAAVAVALLTAVLQTSASAQSGAYRVPANAAFQTPGLASADLFPPIFLPFHGDWRTRTVAMPARAVNAPSGFVALEYDRSPTFVDATVSEVSRPGPQFGYLLLSSDRTRLFALSVGGNRTLQDNSSSLELRSASQQNRLNQNMAVSGRFALIREALDGTGLHAGIHASYVDMFRRQTSDANTGLLVTSGGASTFDTTWSAIYDRSFFRTLSAGIELGRSSTEMEILLDASYHRSLDYRYESNNEYSLFLSQSDPADPPFNVTERVRNNLYREVLDGQLNAVSATAWLRTNGETEGRSVFFIANVIMGFGTIDGVLGRSILDRTTRSTDGTVVDLTESSSNVDATVDQTSNSLLFRIGSGVEGHKTFGALTASGGLAVNAVSSTYKRIPIRRRGSLTYYETTPVRSIGATAPLIAYLEIYRGISLLGGVILDAGFTYTNRQSSSTNLTGTTQAADKASQLSIAARYPLGIIAKHQSGFFLQAAFGGDLAAYANWRVTLGMDLD